MRLLSRSWLFGVLVLAGASVAAEPSLAPTWQGTGEDGGQIHFTPEHLQRPALLLFWATWCPYCEALMPYLQRVQDAAGKEALDVYAIDFKDDGDPAQTLHERKFSFTLVRDGDAIAKQYGVTGTPGLFLVDAKGRIVYKRSGGDAPEIVEQTLRDKLGLHRAAADQQR